VVSQAAGQFPRSSLNHAKSPSWIPTRLALVGPVVASTPDTSNPRTPRRLGTALQAEPEQGILRSQEPANNQQNDG